MTPLSQFEHASARYALRYVETCLGAVMTTALVRLCVDTGLHLAVVPFTAAALFTGYATLQVIRDYARICWFLDQLAAKAQQAALIRANPSAYNVVFLRSGKAPTKSFTKPL